MAAKEQKFERLEDLRSDSSVSIEKNDSASHEFNKRLVTKRKVLNPHEPLLQKWNKIFVITCVMAIFVDPLFFYISVINDKGKCLKLDETLKITTCVLRTFFDLLYVLRIIFQFRTGFIAPSSRVFGRGELIDDSIAIMKRYLTSNFIIDILSIIPLPQVSASSTHSLILKLAMRVFLYIISYLQRKTFYIFTITSTMESKIYEGIRNNILQFSLM
nr:cyclic nucleotide-gated ion channel 1 [Arachis hypogaea]